LRDIPAGSAQVLQKLTFLKTRIFPSWDWIGYEERNSFNCFEGPNIRFRRDFGPGCCILWEKGKTCQGFLPCLLSQLQKSVIFALALAVSRLTAAKHAFFRSSSCKIAILQLPLLFLAQTR
jgi:hypothetical protein